MGGPNAIPVSQRTHVNGTQLRSHGIGNLLVNEDRHPATQQMPHQAHTRHIWCRTHTFSRPSARCLASCKKCKCNRRLRDPRPTSEPAGHGLTANPEKYHPESGVPSTYTHPSRVLPSWRISTPRATCKIPGGRFRKGASHKGEATRPKPTII